MPLLDSQEIRFRILRAMQELPRSILRNLAGKPVVRERALEVATDAVAERFADCQIEAQEPPRWDFGDIKNG